MAFPLTPLDIRSELLLSGVQTRLIDDNQVRSNPGITITRGRKNEQALTTATQVITHINNKNGLYSDRNPRSSLFHKLGRNTQLRHRVEGIFPSPSIRAFSSLAIGTAGSGSVLTPTGTTNKDILIAFHSTDTGSSSEDMAEPSGTWELLGEIVAVSPTTHRTKIWWRRAHGGEPSSYTFTQDSGSDGVISVVAIKDAAGYIPVIGMSSIASATTTVSTPSTTPGGDNDFELRWVSANITPATTWTPPVGFTEHIDISSGTFISGTLASRTLASNAATGTHNFTASAALDGPATGVTVNFIADNIRCVVEIPDWPQEWDNTGNDVYVPLRGAGIMERLSTHRKTIKSALYSAIQASNPVAWYPFDDGSDSATAESGLEGHSAALPFLNKFSFGNSIVPWLETGLGPDADGNIDIRGSIPMSDTAIEWTADITCLLGPGVNARMIVYGNGAGNTGNPRNSWEVHLNGPSSVIEVFTIADEGTTSSSTLVGSFDIDIYNDKLHHVRLTVQNTGAADLSWQLNTSNRAFSGSAVASSFLQPLSSFKITSSEATSKAQLFSNFAAWDVFLEPMDSHAAFGFSGEKAATRFIRLCRAENVQYRVIGRPGDSIKLGPQPIDTFLNVLRDTERTTMDILTEPRDFLGLEYIITASLFNQTAVTLDYPSPTSHLSGELRPIEDAQLIRNKVRASRRDGGTFTYEKSEGRLSTAAPPEGIEEYEEDFNSLTAQHDGDLPELASFRTNRGTWDEARYPHVSYWLQRDVYTTNTALRLSLAQLNIGKWLTITNPPDWLPPDDIELLTQGVTEFLQNFKWEFDWNTIPAGIYRAFNINSSALGRLDSGFSELSEDAALSAISLEVFTSKGPLWIEGGTSFDVMVKGSRLRVTNVGSIFSDFFDRTEVDQWGNALTGQPWISGGGTASNYHVSTGHGRITIPTGDVNSRRMRITQSFSDIQFRATARVSALATGGNLFTQFNFRIVDESNLYRLSLALQTDGTVDATLSTIVAGSGTTLGTANNVINYSAASAIRVTIRAIGNLIQCRIWDSTVRGETLESWNISAIDPDNTYTEGGIGVRALISGTNTNVNPEFSWDSIALETPQKFTVNATRVNGIDKALTAGDKLELFPKVSWPHMAPASFTDIATIPSDGLISPRLINRKGIKRIVADVNESETFGTLQDKTLLSLTKVLIEANRAYRVRFYCGWRVISGTPLHARPVLYQDKPGASGGTLLAAFEHEEIFAGVNIAGHGGVCYLNRFGSVDTEIDLVLSANVDSGTATMFANNTLRRWMLIEDVGEAADFFTIATEIIG